MPKRSTARIGVALLVISAHCIVWWLATRSEWRLVESGSADSTRITVSLLSPTSFEEMPDAPEFHIAPLEVPAPDVDLIAPPDVLFEGAPPRNRETGAGFSPPTIDSLQPIDPAPFARMAGLIEGRQIEIMVLIQVAYDGVATSVTLERGTGDERIDKAALAYARALHWVPGTMGGEPHSMRTRLTVTLRGVY